MNMDITPDDGIFRCDECAYTTQHRGDFRKHLRSVRHIKTIDGLQTDSVACECGRRFGYKRNLARHRKTCSHKQPTEAEQLADIVKVLIAENQKLSEQLKDLAYIKDSQTATHTTSSGQSCAGTAVTNNINGDYKPQYITAIKDSQINMQVFLDSHCSQAVNLTSFIETLRLNSADLDATRERGLAYSLGNVLVRGLRELEMEKRPIHCSNVRKSVMYVKDNDAWGLDKKEVQLRNAINLLSSKQVTQIQDWERSHPNWDKTDAGKQLYAETVHKILQVARDADKAKIEDQVIKTIAKETLVSDSI